MNKKSKIAKWVIQAIAAILGVIAVLFTAMGIFFVVTAFSRGVDASAILVVCMSAIFILSGLLTASAAYKALFRFSADALANVTGILGFIVYLIVSAWLRKYEDLVLDPDIILLGFAYLFAPIVAGYGFHKLLKWLFIKLIYEDETKEVVL